MTQERGMLGVEIQWWGRAAVTVTTRFALQRDKKQADLLHLCASFNRMDLFKRNIVPPLVARALHWRRKWIVTFRCIRKFVGAAVKLSLVMYVYINRKLDRARFRYLCVQDDCVTMRGNLGALPAVSKHMYVSKLYADLLLSSSVNWSVLFSVPDRLLSKHVTGKCLLRISTELLAILIEIFMVFLSLCGSMLK
jgi:hypothetical protein